MASARSMPACNQSALREMSNSRAESRCRNSCTVSANCIKPTTPKPTARIKATRSRVPFPRTRTKAFAVKVNARKAPMVSILAQREGSAEKVSDRRCSATENTATPPAIAVRPARPSCVESNPRHVACNRGSYGRHYPSSGRLARHACVRLIHT